MNYYNEFDPYAAQWLRNLIAAGLLPLGDVDDRPIQEVKANELKNYTQCHFFAGIGGWSLALQLAGWPTDRPVWTGSCPCQPFSSAGRQKGKADDRHLWPVWFGLIQECRPSVIFGEQVASAVAHGWLDDVYQGMEAEGYAVASAVLPACSVGAPHKRDRLWFVAHTEGERGCRTIGASIETPWRSTTRNSVQFGGASKVCGTMGHSELPRPHESKIVRCSEKGKEERGVQQSERSNSHSTLADTQNVNRDGRKCQDDCGQGRENERAFGTDSGADSTLAHSDNTRPQGHGRPVGQHDAQGWKEQVRWDTENCVWIDCPDGKQRLVKSSIPLLAHGIPARVGRLRAYGNAIVPQVAAEFIRASI